MEHTTVRSLASDGSRQRDCTYSSPKVGVWYTWVHPAPISADSPKWRYISGTCMLYVYFLRRASLVSNQPFNLEAVFTTNERDSNFA